MYAGIPVDATVGAFQLLTYCFTTLALLLSWFVFAMRG